MWVQVQQVRPLVHVCSVACTHLATGLKEELGRLSILGPNIRSDEGLHGAKTGFKKNIK
jgi:hypothetical protein